MREFLAKHFPHLLHTMEPYVHVSYCFAVAGESFFKSHLGIYPGLAGVLGLIVLLTLYFKE